MDFIEGFLPSTGYNVILIMEDHLSKYAHVSTVKCPFTALKIAQIFIRDFVILHCILKMIISDRDRIFMSVFCDELFRLQGTELQGTSSYHHKLMENLKLSIGD